MDFWNSRPKSKRDIYLQQFVLCSHQIVYFHGLNYILFIQSNLYCNICSNTCAIVCMVGYYIAAKFAVGRLLLQLFMIGSLFGWDKIFLGHSCLRQTESSG